MLAENSGRVVVIHTSRDLEESDHLFNSIREGNFKLIEFFEDDRLELYDLADDIGELQNLAQKMPQRVRSFEEKQEWRTSVKAEMIATQSPLPEPSVR